MRRVLASLVLSLLAGACADAALESTRSACVSDATCPSGSLCLLGECRNPGAENLGRVDIHVSPLPDTGLRAQSFVNLDPRRGSSEEFFLRPTYDVTLRACFKCEMSPYGVIPGDLTLAGPVKIEGIQPIEVAAVDGSGLARMGLLEDTPYEPMLMPAELSAPILRGLQILVSARLTDGPVQVALPDPSDVFVLSGTIVADDNANIPVPVPTMHVWAMQGTERLTRDVIADEDGHFELRILRSTASGITLQVAPAHASDPLPHLSVPGVNLNGDKDLGLVSLGLASEPLEVSGRVIGTDGNGVAGAFVRLEGPAGAGTLRMSVVSNGEGHYSMQVPRGTYSRAVIPPQATGGALKQDDRIVVGGSDGGAHEQAMDVALGAHTQLCGFVRDVDGNGVPSAAVTAVRIGNVQAQPGPASDVATEARTTTGSDGSFCVAVDPGRYLLGGMPPASSRKPGRTDQLDVGSSVSTVWHDLLLPAAAFIVGVVRSPGGEPLKLARVRAYSAELSSRQGALQLGETLTDNNGSFTLTVPDLKSSEEAP